jgi:hypothetical protein
VLSPEAARPRHDGAVQQWQPGQVVLRREWLHGHLWTVIPLRVVSDEPGLLAVYLAEGTPFGFPDWPLEDHVHPWKLAGHTHWHGHGKLMLHRPGDPYSVDLFWEGPGRSFSGFYFNLQAPFVRHDTGFDTLDHELDLWWPVGKDWVVKDEELFEQRIAEGRYSAEVGDEVRAAGEDLRRLLDDGPHWWNTGWDRWAPPADWTAPQLPDGWQHP